MGQTKHEPLLGASLSAHDIMQSASRLRVALFIDGLHPGGAQRQLVSLARGLKASGLADPEVLTYHDSSFFQADLDELGIVRKQIPRRSRLSPFFVLRLRSSLRGSGRNLVHSFLTGPNLWAALATRLSSVRLVASERSAFDATSGLDRVLRSFSYRRSDLVIANSTRSESSLRRSLRNSGTAVRYVPNGIDIKKWRTEERLEPDLHLPHCERSIVVLGLPRPEKNHLGLIHALALARTSIPSDVRFLLVGAQGQPEKGSEQIAALVRRHGLEGMIRLLPPTKRVASLLTRAEALVLPSKFEGFSNVVLEAMASRCLVVSTPVGQTAKMLSGRRVGILAHGSAPEDIASALLRMFSLSQEERALVTERALELVREEYTLEKVVRLLVECYAGILGTVLERKR